MKKILFLLLFCISIPVSAQLGFCKGSKGDPIFQEDFGSNSGYGNQLPSGTTNYTYVRRDPAPGQYAISDIVGQNNTTWHPYFPETISGGRALLIDADYNAGKFYQTQISDLCENTSYEFSAFVMNIYDRMETICPNGGIPVNVRFEIWDEKDKELLAEASTGNIPSTSAPEWEQYALTFQSEPGQETVILKMYNNGIGGCGNDLAIDDIIFRSCGDLTEVTTITEETSFTICESDAPQAVELMATPDFSAYDNHYFQWQESADHVNWADIAGETDEFFESPQLNETRYYRVKVAEDQVNLDDNLCSTVSESFKVSFVENPSKPVSNGDLIACGNESFPELSVNVQSDESVNWYIDETGGVPIAENTITYTPEAPGIYYAEAVKTGFECGGSKRIAVSFDVADNPEVEDEALQLCEGSEIQLNAGVEAADYVWNTGEDTREITISEPGEYLVNVTNKVGCSSEKNIVVNLVDIAGIDEIISDENRVIIKPENEGDFEYSLDGINFQTNNEFEASGGIYTAYIRDRAGCSTISEKFPHIVTPKFITPNGDGYNDTFQIQGLSYFDSSEISIYDRYGKLLITGKGEHFSWDGTFDNRQLPADDYWYEVKIEGFKPRKGNFTLKH